MVSGWVFLHAVWLSVGDGTTGLELTFANGLRRISAVIMLGVRLDTDLVSGTTQGTKTSTKDPKWDRKQAI